MRKDGSIKKKSGEEKINKEEIIYINIDKNKEGLICICFFSGKLGKYHFTHSPLKCSHFGSFLHICNLEKDSMKINFPKNRCF